MFIFFENLVISHFEEAKNAFKDRSYILNNSIFKKRFGVKWQKVFYQHANTSKDYFLNGQEVLEANTQRKYSILGKIDQIALKKNGRYEFLLEYPEYGYNRWQQSKVPNSYRESDQNVEGYIDIDTQMKENWGGGLALATVMNRFCYITGCSRVNYWQYCIGMFLEGAEKYNGGIPAITGSYHLSHYVNLWVAVSYQTKPFSKLLLKKKKGALRMIKIICFLPFFGKVEHMHFV